MPSLQVEDNNKFERVGGTSMGGGTFWGLGSLLTNAKVCKILSIILIFKTSLNFSQNVSRDLTSS